MIWDASDANPMHRRLPAEVRDGWDEDKMIQVTESLVVFTAEITPFKETSINPWYNCSEGEIHVFQTIGI